ncbi:M20 family metallopeptidase, partial [candidate division WWE3 bacterium]|nr:M20 family metallopeptidase [candidate division WWE3 bacterium]
MENSATLDILKELIKIPSYFEEKNNERNLGFFIMNYLKANTDLQVDQQEVENGRFNIIAYKNLEPKLILFGHLDTVPPKVETLNPFSGEQKGQKLYGLGSVDMKAGIATMLEIAKKYRKSDQIAYIFTVDEEYEFKGAHKIIEKYIFNPEYTINLEPTDLKILNGCRGVTEFSFLVHGKSSHAGTKHLGVNAIEKAVELSNLIQSEISEFDTTDSKNSFNLAYLNGGILSKDGNVMYSGNVV